LLHYVACAEFMESDYFLTSDDRLLKRCKSNILQVKNPVEFIFIINGKKTMKVKMQYLVKP